MRWTSVESCREFHKLFIEYKIIEIGVRSKKLWSKHEEADLCAAPVKSMHITGYSDAYAEMPPQWLQTATSSLWTIYMASPSHFGVAGG